MLNQQAQLKKRIFNIKQFNETIKDYKQILLTLEPDQKISIKRGRYKKQYQMLINCSKNNIREQLQCYKQTLHNLCSDRFKEMTICLKNDRPKKQCDAMSGKYFICIDGKMKNIVWSSSKYY